MRRTLAATLLVLAACGQTTRKKPDDPKPEAKPITAAALATTFSIDYTNVRRGQSVLFSIKGTGPDRIYKISIVSEVGLDIWTEERFPPDPPQYPYSWIQKILMDRTGKAKEIWFGQMGTERPQRIWSLKDTKVQPEIRRKGINPQVLQARDGEKTQAGGKIYDCTLVYSKLLIGQREFLIMDWCSKDVFLPILQADGKAYGGLVRRVVREREGEEVTTEIMSIGKDAREELRIPE